MQGKAWSCGSAPTIAAHSSCDGFGTTVVAGELTPRAARARTVFRLAVSRTMDQQGGVGGEASWPPTACSADVLAPAAAAVPAAGGGRSKAWATSASQSLVATLNGWVPTV